jgi:hypothetical protein
MVAIWLRGLVLRRQITDRKYRLALRAAATKRLRAPSCALRTYGYLNIKYYVVILFRSWVSQGTALAGKPVPCTAMAGRGSQVPSLMDLRRASHQRPGPPYRGPSPYLPRHSLHLLFCSCRPCAQSALASWAGTSTSFVSSCVHLLAAAGTGSKWFKCPMRNAGITAGALGHRWLRAAP